MPLGLQVKGDKKAASRTVTPPIREIDPLAEVQLP
jgi:hypothetical protein